MLIVAHRKNTAAELAATPVEFGIEADIRNHGDRLVMHHDAFAEGEDFEQWLNAFHHTLLIANVKEEGLEKRVIEILEKRGIENFIFLDVTPPFTLKLLRGQIRADGAPEPRVALRLSEYEAVANIIALHRADLIADWVWVDFAEEVALDERKRELEVAEARDLLRDAKMLQELGYKICLVSPELYGPQRLPEQAVLRQLLADEALSPDAVCTKRPELWGSKRLEVRLRPTGFGGHKIF